MTEKTTTTKRRTKSPTMNDVATVAGVSVATVSAVVNNVPIVRPKLKDKIEAVIEEIGYKRNTIARSLKTGKTRTIGLNVADIVNPFFTELVSSIQDYLQEQGYAVILSCATRDNTTEEAQIKLLLDRMVDGIIIAPASDDERLKNMIKSIDIPVVLVDRICEGVSTDSVVVDNTRSVSDLITYLIHLGHKRIGFISGSGDTSTARDRLAGYKEALAREDLPFDQGLVRSGRFREGDGYNAAVELLSLPNRPTALFASNNLMVIGAMKAIRDFGLSCPEDISVACFDDFRWADVFEPRLTTIAQPVQAIGEQASRLMLERLSGQVVTDMPRRITLASELIVRNSCRPAAIK